MFERTNHRTPVSTVRYLPREEGIVRSPSLQIASRFYRSQAGLVTGALLLLVLSSGCANHGGPAASSTTPRNSGFPHHVVAAKADTTRPVEARASDSILPFKVSAQDSAVTAQPRQVEPPAKIIIDSPLPEPLSRGVVFIQYRTENLRIAPMFGPAAHAVSPRVGHIHVTVDDTPWYWADAGGGPLIISGLAPGEHKIHIQLVNPIHQPIEKTTVQVTVPATKRY